MRQLDVSGLDVSVDDSFLVRRFQRFGNLDTDRKSLFGAQSMRGNLFGERHAGHQFHDQQINAFGLFQIMDSRDVGVVERCQHLRFVLENA